MTLLDWLDDLTVRFLLNLPPAEMSSMPRLCFQVEEAQWFYEDFVRPANPQLPSLNLRQFCLTLFRHSPLLSGFSDAQHAAAYEEFLAYKVRVPVRGAILMDENMGKVLLVRGWKKGASWSFPRGKINRDEKDLDCAIREVYEETGYDVRAAGLVSRNEEQGEVKAIDITMREQHMRLFVFRGVPLDTHFEPRTRREIGKIEWYNIKDLPGFKKHKGQVGHGQGEATSTKFYMVAPFLPQLKKWIGQQMKKDAALLQYNAGLDLPTSYGQQAAIVENEGEAEPAISTVPASFEGLQSAEGLKRLLSIKAGPAPTAEPLVPRYEGQEQDRGQGAHLLSLLKGGAPANVGVPAWQQAAQELPAQYSANMRIQPQPGMQTNFTGPTLHETFRQTAPHEGLFGSSRIRQAPQYTTHHLSGSPQHADRFPVELQSVPAVNDGLLQNQRHYSENDHKQAFGNPSSTHDGHMMSIGVVGHVPDRSTPGPHAPSSLDQHNVRAPGTFDAPQSTRTPNTALLGLFQHGSAVSNAALPAVLSQSQDHSGYPPTTQAFGKQPSDAGSRSDVLQSLANQLSAAGGASRFQPGHPVQPPQGANGPIASGPSVPEASKLPAPKLNAHSMKLLDALKGTERPKESNGNSQAATGNIQTGPSHQTNLLSLFKKSSEPAISQRAEMPLRHTDVANDVSERNLSKPPHLDTNHARKMTPDNVTGFMPKVNSRAPPAANSPVELPAGQLTPRASGGDGLNPKQSTKREARVKGQKPTPASAVASQTAPDRPKSRGQLYDPTQPSSSSQVNVPRLKVEAIGNHGSRSPQQRPAAKSGSRSSGGPTKNRSPENGQPTPQFSILQRPGSSAGRTSMPQSPLRNEAPGTGFHPQVLKRPTSGENFTTSNPIEPRPSGNGSHTAPIDKKDQLLALFGKKASPEPVAQPTTASQQGNVPRKDEQQKDKLLNLFNAKPSASATPSPEPPSAPQLVPESRASSSQSRQASGNSQQLLLNLFNSTNSATTASPSTPISPFALGTPVTRLPNKFSTEQPGQPRSRLGSFQASTLGGPPTPSSATPTETKEFLLGYLNGVVKKEGQKNERRA